MRTIEQAIQEETRQYVLTCSGIARCRAYIRGADDYLASHAMEDLPALERRAHIHALAIKRLRHYVVTDHEAVCAATPTVHAYADLDGYSR